MQRLGAGPHGIETVKKHAWFGKVDWAKVMDGALLFPPVRLCMRSRHAASRCGPTCDRMGIGTSLGLL